MTNHETGTGHMIEIDGRRLTGANLFADGPLAIVEVNLPEAGAERIIRRWSETVQAIYEQLQRPPPNTGLRMHGRGQSLYFPAPIDTLYSAIELSEFAVNVALGDFTIDARYADETGQQDQTMTDHLRQEFERESCPALLELEQWTKQHRVPFLWCDDFVSLGFGKYSKTWERSNLPDPKNMDWNQSRSIPFALITGTNGKSTTTRLCSQILSLGGHTVGYSSTDGIWVGDQCIDSGDFSGPGGAREVLRNRSVERAVLEVARGGLLRRGLGASGANAALITNVAEDHLGEYGVNTIGELVEAKFIIRKSLHDNGKLILNADDEGCVAFAEELDQEIVWFSLHAGNSLIQQQLKQAGEALYCDQEKLKRAYHGNIETICAIADIPITFNGAAKHNVANALAASAVCYALGTSTDQIVQGLTRFKSNRENNPGRGNLFQVDDFSVMVDFAHNPHGLSAVVDTLLQMPAERRLVMMGHAGDRSDEDIRALTRVAMRLAPDRVVIYELEAYLRGRNPGEVPALIEDALDSCAMPATAIAKVSDPVSGTRAALEWAREGDFLLLLTLGDRDRVFALIDDFANQRPSIDQH